MLKFAMYYLSLRKNLIGSRGVSKQLQCISQPRETCRLCRRMLTHTMWVKCLALHSDIAHLLFSSSIQPFPPSLLPSLPPSLHLPPSLLPPSFALSFPLSFPLSLSPSLILPLSFPNPFLSSLPFYHSLSVSHPLSTTSLSPSIQQLLYEIEEHQKEAEYIQQTVDFLVEHSRKEKREELTESAKDFVQRYHSLLTSVKTYVSNMQDFILVCILTNLKKLLSAIHDMLPNALKQERASNRVPTIGLYPSCPSHSLAFVGYPIACYSLYSQWRVGSSKQSWWKYVSNRQ